VIAHIPYFTVDNPKNFGTVMALMASALPNNIPKDEHSLR
jgi:hypothetical protein